MNIVELLNDEIMCLPKIYSNSDYIDFIEKIFKDYLKKIDELDNIEIAAGYIKEKKGIIEEYCNKLQECIQEYYSGYPFNSYNILSDALSGVVDYLEEHYKVLNSEDYTPLKSMYRIRIGKECLFSRKEMFHIPFDKRTIVDSHRYSIAGLPSLYLGSSAYICWEELGNPDFNLVQISRIECKNEYSIKILDLSYTPSFIAHRLNILKKNYDDFFSGLQVKYDINDIYEQYNDIYEQYNNEILSFFINWPLIASCSIRVKDRNNRFKPEYIIPQLLLQWVRANKDFDGIKYFSTNIYNETYNISLYQNYVFPVKEVCKEGVCPKLKEKFLITDTLSWQKAKTYKINLKPEDIPIKYNPDKKIELLKGLPHDYWDTDFGYIEKLLLSMNAYEI